MAGPCREKLLDLSDKDHEISRGVFRRPGRSERSGAPLLDRRLVGRAKRLGHEQNFTERAALDRHLPGCLDEVVTDYTPMAFAGPAGSPGRQFGLVPEVVHQAQHAEPPRVAFGIVRGVPFVGWRGARSSL